MFQYWAEPRRCPAGGGDGDGAFAEKGAMKEQVRRVRVARRDAREAARAQKPFKFREGLSTGRFARKGGI